MKTRSWHLVLVAVVLTVAVLACGVQLTEPTGNNPATDVAATIFVLQTGVSGSQTAQAGQAPVQPSVTPQPTVTHAPAATNTPKGTIVINTALCSTGPGPVYGVVSSVKQGTEVNLLGVGSKAGWFVIENPTYHDRCWIEAKNLQIDPNFNLASLQVYNPPPTPGPKITPAPTATP